MKIVDATETITKYYKTCDPEYVSEALPLLISQVSSIVSQYKSKNRYNGNLHYVVDDLVTEILTKVLEKTLDVTNLTAYLRQRIKSYLVRENTYPVSQQRDKPDIARVTKLETEDMIQSVVGNIESTHVKLMALKLLTDLTTFPILHKNFGELIPATLLIKILRVKYSTSQVLPVISSANHQNLKYLLTLVRLEDYSESLPILYLEGGAESLSRLTMAIGGKTVKIPTHEEFMTMITESAELNDMLVGRTSNSFKLKFLNWMDIHKLYPDAEELLGKKAKEKIAHPTVHDYYKEYFERVFSTYNRSLELLKEAIDQMDVEKAKNLLAFMGKEKQIQTKLLTELMSAQELARTMMMEKIKNEPNTKK